MILTNKITYLVTEYNINVKPTIDDITAYASKLNALASKDLLGSNFSKLNPADLASVNTEIEALRSGNISAIKSKLYPLATTLATKAGKLLVTNKDHVVDMSENVETDGGISGTTAQVQALKTTATGMTSILPGGGSGAAVVVAENAETIINLATQTEAKVEQVNNASKLIPTMTSAVTDLAAFTKILPSLAPTVSTPSISTLKI